MTATGGQYTLSFYRLSQRHIYLSSIYCFHITVLAHYYQYYGHTNDDKNRLINIESENLTDP